MVNDDDEQPEIQAIFFAKSMNKKKKLIEIETKATNS